MKHWSVNKYILLQMSRKSTDEFFNNRLLLWICQEKIPNAIYATKYSKGFGIDKKGQDNIYTNKIKLIHVQGKKNCRFQLKTAQ